MERHHPLEKHREIFNEACSQKNINPIIAESLFNQISTELELAEALHGLIRKDSSATEPPSSRRSSYIQPRKQSLCVESLRLNNSSNNSSSSTFADRHREKPAQLKLEKEIEDAKKRADELRSIQSIRQLSAAEIEELKEAELLEYESKKKLKRTKDAAARAKRYRIRKANEHGNGGGGGFNNNNNLLSLETHFEESLNSPEDLRSSSSTSFNESSFPSLSKAPTLSISPSCRKRPYSPSPPSTTFQQTNNFVCPSCDCNFPNLSLFISHMRTQHLQNSSPESSDSFFCRICKASYPVASNRLSHMIEHFIGNSSIISCQHCSKQFENSANFRQHFLACHSEILHRCNICYKVFTQNSAFQDHMNLHMSSEIRYTCVACPSLSFESYEHFESHIQIFHDGKNELNGISAKSSKHHNAISDPPIIAGSTLKPLKCIVCDKECVNESVLDEHRLFNHCKVPKSDRCTVCRQILTGLSDFTTHMHLHSSSDGGINNEMDCIVCRQKIRNDTQIKMHAEYHLDMADNNNFSLSPSLPTVSITEATTTKCSICNYSISTDELAKHYLQHASSGECLENGDTHIKSEIFDDSRCNINNIQEEQQQYPISTAASDISNAIIPLICHCGQQFEDENELTAHALEHLNETFPGCSGSNNNDAIQHHQQQHHHPQSFDCPRCPKRFASLSALQGHSHVHMTQRIFKCSKCSHTFSSAFRLQQHRFKHASKNDLKCRICDKKFLTAEDLQCHMLVHESNLTSFVAANNPLLHHPSKPSNEALEV